MDMKRERSTERHSRMTTIESMMVAMFRPKEYGDLLKKKTNQVVGYIIAVILLVCLIQYAVPATGAIAGLGGMKDIIMYEVPEFSLDKGKFYLEEKIERIDEVSGVCLIVDTTVDEFTKSDVPENMMQAVLVSENNMLVYNSMYGMGGVAETQSFAAFKDLTISNKTVADMSGFIYFMLICLFLMLCFATMAEYLIYALFYALCMFILVKGSQLDLTFGKVYKVTLFAQTLGALLKAVAYAISSSLFLLVAGFLSLCITVVIMNKVILQYKLCEEA